MCENNDEFIKIIKSCAEDEINIDKISQKLPTDISYWPSVIEFIQKTFLIVKTAQMDDFESAFIKTTDKETKEITVLILWIKKLLLNPFDIDLILNINDYNLLKHFLIFNIKKGKNKVYLNWVTQKLILKSLAHLAMNELKKNTTDELKIIDKNLFKIFGFPMLETHFYCFLKYLSIIYSSYFENNEEITSLNIDENLVIKRYKIKIISYLSTAKNAVNNLKSILLLINHENTKLGWTLSKAAHRISRFLDKKSLSIDLIKSLGGVIFSNEEAWINSLTIVSLISFEITNDDSLNFIKNLFDFDNFIFVNTSLTYNNEFEPKSINLREMGLFFVWSILRSVDFSILEEFKFTDIIYRVIFISLFDIEFICRRAAVDVLQEFLGRMRKDYFDSSDVTTFFKITKSSIKRNTDCLDLFCNIKNKKPFEKFILDSIYSFDDNLRKLSATIITKYYNPYLEDIKYSTVYEMDGINLLINEIIINKDDLIGRSQLNDHKFYEKFINSFELTNLNYSKRKMSLVITSYLEIAAFFDIKKFFTNVLFLTNKNFDPIKIQKSSQIIFENINFSEQFLKIINKNSTSILINSNNAIFKKEVLEKYNSNLENKIHVSYTIEAIRLMEYFPTDNIILFDNIKSYLFDYSIGFDGDIGYFNRKAAFLYIFNYLKNLKNDISSNISEIQELVEKMIIKFLSDKSKKLRDFVLSLLLKSPEFSEFIPDFPYLIITEINENNIIKNYRNEFKLFFEEHRRLFKNKGNDYSYFVALHLSFCKFDDFWLGIKNTYSSADFTLKNLLNNFLQK